MTKLERLRRSYLRHPTKAALRAYLIVKARRGHFDPRMCSLHGVSPAVNLGTRRFIARAYASKLIPTSTTGGVHSPTSFHPKGQAADIGVVPALVGTRIQLNRLRTFQAREFAAWRQGDRPRMLELIGPINDRVVLRDMHSPLAEGTALENQHDNHVHGAFR